MRSTAPPRRRKRIESPAHSWGTILLVRHAGFLLISSPVFLWPGYELQASVSMLSHAVDIARLGLCDGQSGRRAARHAVRDPNPRAAAGQSATAREHQSAGLPARVPSRL